MLIFAVTDFQSLPGLPFGRRIQVSVGDDKRCLLQAAQVETGHVQKEGGSLLVSSAFILMRVWYGLLSYVDRVAVVACKLLV